MRLLRRISYHQMSFALQIHLIRLWKNSFFIEYRWYHDYTAYVTMKRLIILSSCTWMKNIRIHNYGIYFPWKCFFFFINCWCAHNNVVYCIWIWLTIRRMNCYFLSIPLEWRKTPKTQEWKLFSFLFGNAYYSWCAYEWSMCSVLASTRQPYILSHISDIFQW